MELLEYKNKRDFKKTPEPPPRKVSRKDNGLFVVQKHDSKHLHFDLRLEIGGVLKSWMVPKGPSMNPHEKRLAMLVEDYPISYLKFEGRIPEGQYGEGTVEIWDSGKWEPTEQFTDIEQSLNNGLIEFTLNGNKLKGKFILVEMEYSINGNGWLLVKREDQEATYEPYDATKIE